MDRYQELLKIKKQTLAKLAEIKKRGGSVLLDHGSGAVEADEMETRVLNARLEEIESELKDMGL